jgi:putative thioredoxin
MIRLVKISDGEDKRIARDPLLQLFSLVDPADPDLISARKELASALY